MNTHFPKHSYKTYSEMIRPITPMSTFPLNSKLATKPLVNVKTNSESGTNSTKPGVCIAKN